MEVVVMGKISPRGSSEYMSPTEPNTAGRCNDFSATRKHGKGFQVKVTTRRGDVNGKQEKEEYARHSRHTPFPEEVEEGSKKSSGVIIHGFEKNSLRESVTWGPARTACGGCASGWSPRYFDGGEVGGCGSFRMKKKAYYLKYEYKRPFLKGSVHRAYLAGSGLSQRFNREPMLAHKVGCFNGGGDSASLVLTFNVGP